MSNIPQHRNNDPASSLLAKHSPEMIANITNLQRPVSQISGCVTHQQKRCHRPSTPYQTSSFNSIITTDTKLGTRQIGFQDDPSAPTAPGSSPRQPDRRSMTDSNMMQHTPTNPRQWQAARPPNRANEGLGPRLPYNLTTLYNSSGALAPGLKLGYRKPSRLDGKEGRISSHEDWRQGPTQRLCPCPSPNDRKSSASCWHHGMG